MKDTQNEIEWVGDLEKEKIAYEYLSDNMNKLKEICDPIINQKGFSKTDMNRDDLYSYAIKVMNQSLNTYESGKSSFKTFLTGNLKKKFYTWTRDNERGCRCNVLRDENGKIVKEKGEDGKERNIIIQNVSFDAPSEDEIDLKEKIDSGFDIENVKSKDIFSIEDSFDDFCPKMKNYIRGLSKMQIRILEYLQNGYIEEEIVCKLNITVKTYRDCLNGIKSERNTRKIYSLIRRK